MIHHSIRGTTVILASIKYWQLYLTLCVLNIVKRHENLFSYSINCEITQVVELPPEGRQGFAYPTQSISLPLLTKWCKEPGGCFTNISRALHDILSKFVYCGNSTWYANFKLKLGTCAQRHALGTRTKFHLEILTINVISGIVPFREIILGELAKR